MEVLLTHDPGSFRDPQNRIHLCRSDGAPTTVLRTISTESLDNYLKLIDQPFFSKLIEDRRVVKTTLLDKSDPRASSLFQTDADNTTWAGILEHELVPCISYPYEWSFTQLKDAALAQLALVQIGIENGWTLKDSTPYNFQQIQGRCVFIDIPSFEPYVDGEPWNGYRQFCAMFLYPLMISAHVGIPHQDLLKSQLDGLTPSEAARYFSGTARAKPGVMTHVTLPANVDRRVLKSEHARIESAAMANHTNGAEEPTAAATAKESKPRRHSQAMVLGLLDSLSRLVAKLDLSREKSDWSDYSVINSYAPEQAQAKKEFVARHLENAPEKTVWDLGCNNGEYSKLCAAKGASVVGLDGDRYAIDDMYRWQQQMLTSTEHADTARNLLPLVMDLANPSSGVGWGGVERGPLSSRSQPDLILCLAVVHHLRLTASVPLDLFFGWIRQFNANVIVEYVDRHDEMVVSLLSRKKDQYLDYNLDNFVHQAERYFKIADRETLKGGRREIFYFTPG